MSRFGSAHTLRILSGWAVVLLAGVYAYFPGLHGPFVLDDFGSIAALGERGGVVDWDTFKAFVFGGGAGPTGRPLSLLSFLVDANTWPAESWPFKRTNLAIHLLTGVLFGVVTVQVLRTQNVEPRSAQWIALSVAACWLLHPFLVSTTLYVVQRMAQLSTLFTLAGLSAYMYGRSLLGTNRLRAYIAMSAAIVFFGLLATLSKENGILLPMLIGVFELTIYSASSAGTERLNRLWMTAFIVVPSVVVLAYLGNRVFSGTFFEVVPPRQFSIYERLITQPRVLVEYLQHWFIPKLYTTGVFQDHFIKSTGLLSPVTTLLSIVLHLAAIALAFIQRRKWPLLSMAILFFYAGHLLESTVINLEMYFEHRNYLPAAFLFLPILAGAYKRFSRTTYAVIVVALLILLGSFTRYSATIWSDFSSMVEASAHKAPTSARAQTQYAVNLFNANRIEESLATLDRAIENSTFDDPLLLVNRLVALCNVNRLSGDEFERVARTLSPLKYDARHLKVYTRLAEAVVERRCPAVSNSMLASLFERMLTVPYNADPSLLPYSQITYLLGFARAYNDQADAAIAAFEASLSSRPGATHAMMMAAVLATNGHGKEALYLSDIALEQIEAEAEVRRSGASASRSDILHFQKVVRDEMRASPAVDTPGPAD